MADRARFLRWFIGEIPTLRQQGVIDDTAQSQLLEHYRTRLQSVETARRNRSLSYFFLTLGIFGVLLIGGGILLAVSYNWDMLPRFARLALAALPLLAGVVLGVCTICRKQAGQLSRELAAVITSVGFGVLTAVVSQVYHLGGSFGDFMVLQLALALALVYVFNSIALASLYVFGLFSIVDSYAFSIVSEPISFCAAGVAAFLPYMFYHLLQESPFRIWMRYLAVVLAIFGLVSCTGHYPMLSCLAVATMGLLAGRELYEKQVKNFRNPWLVPSFVFMLVLLGVGSSAKHAFDISTASPLELGAYWVFTGITWGLVVILYLRRRLDVERFMTGLWLLLALLAYCGPSWHETLRIACNIYTIAFGLLLIQRGVRLRQYTTFNGGILLVAVLLSCRFFDDHFDVLFRSIGFIVLGLAFIAANIVFSRRVKAKQLEEQAR